MNHLELLASVEGMLGFTVQERQNDAILVRTPPAGGRSSVRPANGDEVLMFLRLLGLVSTLSDQTAAGEKAREIERQMGDSLQAADARIKELMIANKGLGEERAFLAEVHRERINSMQAKHDAGLIAAAERMQEEWLRRFDALKAEQDKRDQAWARQMEDSEHEIRTTRSMLENAESARESAEEAKESAEEMASQMHSQLSDAEQKIVELKAENASLQEELKKFEMAEGKS